MLQRTATIITLLFLTVSMASPLFNEAAQAHAKSSGEKLAREGEAPAEPQALSSTRLGGSLALPANSLISAGETGSDPAAIGDAAPSFILSDAVTGEDVGLADHEGKVVVLLFHSITCPYYKMNEGSGYDRVFVEMVETYQDKGVVFLGVNANSKETAKKIAKYCEKYEINYPVLKDEGNQVADAYGAEVTPHVMVIDSAGTLRYRGGVEDHAGGPRGCGQSETQYLGPVIDALLKGEDPPYTETEPKGCKIKRG